MTSEEQGCQDTGYGRVVHGDHITVHAAYLRPREPQECYAPLS